MKILVTGGSGMVGNCLKKIINDERNEWIFISSKDCDLTDVKAVNILFKNLCPNYVVHLAANVGGLYKNMREKTSIFRDNVRMNENVLECCHKYNVQKGLFCLSSCIFPFEPVKYPMDITMIHNSPPHPSNEGYGYAKRMLEMQCRNYNEQFNRQYMCIIPVNLYGPYDNFNLDDSHVIPGIIHRMYNSKKNNTDFIMYGSGSPLRQFVYAFDFVKIIIDIVESECFFKKPIICCNDEITIKELTLLIAKLMNYDEKHIKNDLTKSDGSLIKTVCSDFEYKYTPIELGLKITIEWFLHNYEKCRK